MSDAYRLAFRCVRLVALLSLPACRGEGVPAWHEGGDHRWRELRVETNEGTLFTQLDPSRVGLQFVNAVPEDSILANELLGSGSGVAVGDYDGDGRPDLYLTSLLGENELYRNLGGWRFEDVTESADAGLPGIRSRGAAFADVDGDGDLDLVVTVHAGRNVLLENDGRGRFLEVDAGFRNEGASTTPSLADVDGDGDLDLYIANNKRAWARDIFPPSELTYDKVIEERGDSLLVRPPYGEHFRLVERNGVLGREEFAEPDELYLNDGSGRFEEVSWTDGRFLDTDGRPLSRAPDDWGLAARFHDVDGDGDPDLYVCNDVGSPDHIWLNDGAGTFRAIAPRAVRTTSSASMAVDFSDIDRDGDVDLLVTEMLALDPARRKTQLDPTGPSRGEIRPQVNRNTLQLNRGDGTFAEIARYAGLAASGWTWGTVFVDADLDGYEDVFMATGHVHDMLSGDAYARRYRETTGADSWRFRASFPVLELRNVAFRNRGDGTFKEVGERWGFSVALDISHGVAAGDLDGDGDLDLVVTRLNRPPLLFRNNADAPRVAVWLRGRAPNTHGVGAVVRLRAGPLPEQRKEVSAGGLYLSGSESLVVFAASERATGELEVEWPGGARSLVRGVRANRLYEVEEPAGGQHEPTPGAGTTSGSGRGTTSGRVAAGAGDAAPYQVEPASHFHELSLGHVHAEEPFDDFLRQPLLPIRLSRLGPGVSWEDVDGDGDPDLVVAAGSGHRLALYRNEGGGRLAPIELDLQASAWDQTTVLGVPDGGGGKALLVGQSSYEAPTPTVVPDVPSVLRYELGSSAGGAASIKPGVSAAIDGQASVTGPLALADVEGDGDLDLFVGGRVLPGSYPSPASSRLYRNEGGRFIEDQAAGRLLEEVGLVSAATFADVDGDGDPDLLLAMEWGPVRLYLNDGRGGFGEATEAWGLDQWPSRWNGLAVGDLDGDGRLDLVTTSWGRNTDREASPERPLLVYAGDFDGNGTTEVLEARWTARLKGPEVTAGFRELTRALPFVRSRVSTYAAYAAATLEDLLGPTREGAYRAEAVTLSHLVFWNRGGSFEPEPLPPAAQLAPSFYAGVADLDGDGTEDVFLTQNFFATGRETPRHDAGRSVWLKGDGRGGLAAVSGRESGIRIYGDPRGAALADYDADGRVDIAVSQNGAETVLLKNEGARPGVRVRLMGPADNPEVVGAQMRLEYADGTRGPVREVVAGSGYWSRDAAIQVLGVAAGREPAGIWVRWPWGEADTVQLEPDALEVRIRAPHPKS